MVQELAFRVALDDPRDWRPGPFRNAVGSAGPLWTPSEWEGSVLAHSEHVVLDAMDQFAAAGDVVYDVGANVGVYACRFADLVGAEGRVYCFEANPVCVSYLQGNVAQQDRQNVEILPVAILDAPGEIDFAIHYGNANLGVTSDSPFYAWKIGHEVRVHCARLDDLLAEQQLRPPNVVKMDVEGAEARALRGMATILRTRRPTLVLELHGRANASASLAQIDPLGYEYVDPRTGARYEKAAAALDAFGDTVFQVVAVAKP